VGVASAAGDGVSAEGLLAAADDALYRAKRGGRDTVRIA
jgi:PleD family two-component response regulator